VLDVACGTGVVARQAARAVGTTGQVTGLDINEGMLHVARTVAPPVGAPITWREGSVMALPFPDATFDAVLCQWGLEFFPDRAQGLREMARVLVPGGRLGLRVWRALDRQPFQTAVIAALDRHLFSGQDVPSRHALLQPFSLADAKALRALVADAGFRDIHVRIGIHPLCVGRGVYPGVSLLDPAREPGRRDGGDGADTHDPGDRGRFAHLCR
jgi:ubiquinone/menaquinone biosynthesis C-methylase UbiE